MGSQRLNEKISFQKNMQKFESISNKPYELPNGKYFYMYINKNGSQYWQCYENSHYRGSYTQWHRDHQTMEIFDSCPFFDKRNGMKYCEDRLCSGDIHFD